jgi:hypothetical protein
MKTAAYFQIAFRIILVFAVAMAMSFIPEHLRDFFGDVPQKPSPYLREEMDIGWDWGVRHWWWFIMMTSLFILTIINLLWSIRNILQRYHNVNF